MKATRLIQRIIDEIRANLQQQRTDQCQ